MDNQLTLKKNNYKGKLIVFEGTDGAGKTTMINLTMNYLTQKYGEENVILQKQPTDLSRKTRLFQKMMYCGNHDEIDYRAVQLLTLSDRVQHNYEVIEPSLDNNMDAIKKLFIGNVKIVVLTLGAQGFQVWFSDGQNIQVNAFRVKQVDTTRAGDTFVGAFLYQLINSSIDLESINKDITVFEKILKFSNYAAALSVGKRGSINSMPYSADVF